MGLVWSFEWFDGFEGIGKGCVGRDLGKNINFGEPWRTHFLGMRILGKSRYCCCFLFNKHLTNIRGIFKSLFFKVF